MPPCLAGCRVADAQLAGHPNADHAGKVETFGGGEHNRSFARCALIFAASMDVTRRCRQWECWPSRKVRPPRQRALLVGSHTGLWGKALGRKRSMSRYRCCLRSGARLADDMRRAPIAADHAAN